MGVVKTESGLTWRSFLGLLYSAIILMPASVFTGLFVGSNLIATFSFPLAGFVTAFLFSEIARMFGRPLKKQEVFIIWSVSLIAGGEAISLLVFQNFFLRSLFDGSWAFKVNGMPLPKLIPDWFAPSPFSPVLELRTFFHQDWFITLLVTLVGTFLFWKALHILYGIICYQVFAVEEKLPFPIQQIAAEACITMAIREKSKMMIMTILAIISAFYTFMLYFVPFVFGIDTIPIPWIDLNKSIELFIPGASFGIATDAIIFAIGMVLPLNVVISMFAGSFLTYFVGNAILVKTGLFPEWRPGMTIALAYQRSILSFWTFPQIGLAIAAGLIPILMSPKTILRSFSSLKAYRIRESPIFSPQFMIVSILTTNCIILTFNHWLTGFPLYGLVTVLIWNFIMSLIMTRGIGESGIAMTVPYVTETLYTIIPYEKIDIWFAPMQITGGGGHWASWFKIAELTGTSFVSYIKAHLIAVLLAWIFSFLYLELFWRIAPIPSVMYPGVSAVWPALIIPRILWATGGVATGAAPIYISSFFLLGAALELIKAFLHIPFSLISIAVGMMTALPVTFSILLGALVAKIISWKFGKEWWRRNRTVIAAGIFLGESLIVVLAVAFTIIMKMMWVLPF